MHHRQLISGIWAGVLLATTAVALVVSAPPAGAVGPQCLDWADFADATAPAGSDSLGVPGTAEDTVDGEQRTLTNVFGEPIDLRITWVDEHDGVILDTSSGGDFTGVSNYTDLLGGAGSTSVLRYFPRADEGGTMHFEFFEAGTTTPVTVEIDQLLIGGHRDFPTRPEGVSEVSLKVGGPSGTAVATSWADPDLVAVDTDPADGLTGSNTTPIIELDTADYGTANATAWNETRNSFVSVGALSTRDWTVIDWGDARADSIVWQLYGSDPEDDPELVSPSAAANHDGLSAYISGFCFTPDPSYDLALAKVLTSYDPSTRHAVFTTTVRNQGGLDSGAFAITDTIPAGLSFVSADNGGAETSPGSGVVVWDIPASSQLAFDETISVSATVRVDDASLAPFTNTAEITADSGDDDDSTTDADPANDNVVDVTDASTLATDTASSTPDEDDHDIAVLDLDFDLALSKGLASAPAELGPGVDVTFELTVTNQGPDVASVTVVDYVQDGFVFDAAKNPSSSATDADGDSWSVVWDATDPTNPVASLTTAAGELTDGDVLTVPVNLTVAPDWDGSALVNWAEIANFDDDLDPGNGDAGSGALTDADSTPDTSQANDNQPTGPGAAGDDVIIGDGDGPDPTTDDEDDHDVAGVGDVELSLGNQVWLDEDNDGTIDADESPIAGVDVVLFVDGDDDGRPDDRDGDGSVGAGDGLATSTTDADGLYLFDGLGAGTYVVGVCASEWDTGGPLRGLLSSDPSASDPDGGVDGDDDGVRTIDGCVLTGTVTLGDGEPTGEEPDNDPSTADPNENLTVDLGFWRPRFDLALRTQLVDGRNRATVAVGDQVTFRITIFNQGQLDACGVNVVDYLPDGLTLDDPDWTANAGGIASIVLADTIPAGGTATVDITVRVGAGATGVLDNVAEISAATPCVNGVPVVMPNGELLPDVDSIADSTDGETPVDDVIDNSDSDEDDHDLARLEIVGGGGGELPRTGSEPRPLIVAAAALMLWGLLFLGLRPQELGEPAA
ncbi:MAG: SdrD B-like domain-containing protein [Actinomycetota bacterium]